MSLSSNKFGLLLVLLASQYRPQFPYLRQVGLQAVDQVKLAIGVASPPNRDEARGKPKAEGHRQRLDSYRSFEVRQRRIIFFAAQQQRAERVMGGRILRVTLDGFLIREAGVRSEERR